MYSIEFKFINRSNVRDNLNVVIFQKMDPSDDNDVVIAWKVIKDSVQGDYHPFTHDHLLAVAASDSSGNLTEPHVTLPGSCCEIVNHPNGNIIKQSADTVTDSTAVDVYNRLDKGSMSVNLYRGGKLLAQKNRVEPGQKVSFCFRPSYFIGVAENIEEGQIIAPAMLAKIKEQIYIDDIVHADLVMKGGGSSPFKFEFENIIYVPFYSE